MKKGNLTKKALSVLMVCSIFMAGVTGCGTSSTSTTAAGTKAAAAATTKAAGSAAAGTTAAGTAEKPKKQYVIGIAEAQANDEVSTRRAYLEKFIAPTYNVKFIFSETLKDDAATKAFIENCADSGANAVIDFKSISGQMAKLCEQNNMIYAVNGTYEQAPELLNDSYPKFAGCVGANNEQVGSLYKDWLEKNASADGSEGFLVSTSLASSGNTQHIEITRAILTGLQEKYGITYEQPIDKLIASSETTNVANSKNLLITLYPGSPNKDTWLPGVSSLLQSGKYGVLLSSGQTYNQSAKVVDEVEKSFKKDIKVASVGALGTTLSTAFNTKDQSGNPSVDLVTVKSGSVLTACLFAITYNALTGDISKTLRADGKPLNYRFNFIAVTSAKQLEDMKGWDDRDAGNWIANKTFVDSMLTIANPNVTGKDIEKIMENVSYDSIKKMMTK